MHPRGICILNTFNMKRQVQLFGELLVIGSMCHCERTVNFFPLLHNSLYCMLRCKINYKINKRFEAEGFRRKSS